MKRIHSIEIARFYQRIENAENKKAEAKRAKAKKSFLRRLLNVWQNEEYCIVCVFRRLAFVCYKYNGLVWTIAQNGPGAILRKLLYRNDLRQ